MGTYWMEDLTGFVKNEGLIMLFASKRTLASGELSYFFGSDDFDNSNGGGFAELEVSATVNTGTNDLVSVVTNRVFVPPANEAYAYDADGNQTLVTTATGEWRVEYNGENRPVRWTCGDKTILMTFDHQGRRRLYVEVAAGVTNKLHRFTYDDYVCIARNREVDAQHGIGTDAFVWDPTEPIATRPLMCNPSTASPILYCHDGNKNVSEAVTLDGTIDAHYEYSSFGKVVLVTSENEDQSAAKLNPYRFSSEYADDALGLVYYNYRHYNPADGRWCSSDPMNEPGFFFAPIVNTTSYCLSSVGFLDNKVPNSFDHVGLLFACDLCEDEKCKNVCNGKLSESGFSGGIYTCQQFILVRCKCYGMCNLLMEIKPPWPRGQYTCFYECGNTQQTWTQYTPCEQHKLWGL